LPQAHRSSDGKQSKGETATFLQNNKKIVKKKKKEEKKKKKIVVFELQANVFPMTALSLSLSVKALLAGQVMQKE